MVHDERFELSCLVEGQRILSPPRLPFAPVMQMVPVLRFERSIPVGTDLQSAPALQLRRTGKVNNGAP